MAGLQEAIDAPSNYMPKLVCYFISLRIRKTMGFSSVVRIYEYFKWIMKISVVVFKNLPYKSYKPRIQVK